MDRVSFKFCNAYLIIFPSFRPNSRIRKLVPRTFSQAVINLKRRGRTALTTRSFTPSTPMWNSQNSHSQSFRNHWVAKSLQAPNSNLNYHPSANSRMYQARWKRYSTTWMETSSMRWRWTWRAWIHMVRKEKTLDKECLTTLTNRLMQTKRI